MSLISGIEVVDSPHPMMMGAQPTLWVDGEDNVTTDDGGVSAWGDKSGNNNNASQSDSAKRPGNGDTINGKTVLTFNGSSDLLDLTSAFVNVDSDFTMFGVCEKAETTSYGAVFCSGDNPITAAGRVMVLLSSNSARYGFTGVGNDFWNDDNCPTYSANTPVCFVIRRVGTECRIFNNRDDVVRTQTIIATNNADVARIGANVTGVGGELFNGNIAELAAWTVGLSTEKIETLLRYGINSWGIS